MKHKRIGTFLADAIRPFYFPITILGRTITYGLQAKITRSRRFRISFDGKKSYSLFYLLIFLRYKHTKETQDIKICLSNIDKTTLDEPAKNIIKRLSYFFDMCKPDGGIVIGRDNRERLIEMGICGSNMND